MLNVDCPCKKKKCKRYGNCDACRKHHAESKRPVACEREKKFLFCKRKNIKYEK